MCLPENPFETENKENQQANLPLSQYYLKRESPNLIARVYVCLRRVNVRNKGHLSGTLNTNLL